MAKKGLQEKGYGEVPVKAHSERPLLTFPRDINWMFDEFFRGFPLIPFSESREWVFVPRVNVSETDDEIKVSAELPGMDEKDIKVSIARGVLTITGEKKEEKEDQSANYYTMERSSGYFHRDIPVPEGTDYNKVKASFKKGVLKVTIPLLPEAQTERKQIPVRSE